MTASGLCVLQLSVHRNHPWRAAPVWLLAAIVLASGVGCQSNRLGRVPKGFKQHREAGIAVIGAQYTFDSTSLIKANTAVHFTLKSNEPVPYKGKVLYPDFRAYVKPKVDVEVVFSEPDVMVSSGWAYLVGTSPIGKTKRVRAVGVGTEMIIEVDDSVSPAMHRVYLVGGSSSVVWIYVPPDAKEYALPELTPGTYGEIKDEDGATWEFKHRYSDDPARAAFVQMVLDEVGSRGVK